MPLVPPPCGLSEDQRLIIETVGEFARTELFPLDRKWDEDESSSADILPKLAEMGILNLGLPEDANGLECPYRVYAAIIHELATWSPSVAVTVAVHSMVGNNLHKFVSGRLRTDLLAHWGDPANFAAFCLSEAGAGSDAGATKTTSRSDP